MWGMTFGVVSKLAVAGGGAAFAYQGPPYYRQVCPNRASVKQPFLHLLAVSRLADRRVMVTPSAVAVNTSYDQPTAGRQAAR